MITKALAVALTLAALTACGPAATAPLAPAQATQPSGASAPTPTAAAPKSTPATAAPAAAAALAGQAAAPTALPTPIAVASSDSTPAAKVQSVTLTLDPAASSASYHAREQLVGKPLPTEATGTSKGVSGSLLFTPDGTFNPERSQISVDLTQLKSDESRRDNWIKGNTLQTSQYPRALFVPKETQGLPSPLPTSGQSSFELSGDLTVHGVTRPVTWQVTAQFTPAAVNGNATTSVKITDFGMTPPTVGPVLGIEDGLTLELAFSAARES